MQYLKYTTNYRSIKLYYWVIFHLAERYVAISKEGINHESITVVCSNHYN